MPQRFRCAVCGQAAELQRVRRTDQTNFRLRLPVALTTGLLGHAAASIVACGVLFSLSQILGVIGTLLGVLGTLIAGLAIMRSAGEGEAFDWMGFADPLEEVAMPLARGLLVLLPLLIPVLLGIKLGITDVYEVEPVHRHSLLWALAHAPAFWSIAIAGIAYAPLALLNATTAQSWGAVVNPITLLKPIRRWPREYGWLTLVAGVGFFATLLLCALSGNGWLGSLLVGVAASATGIATMRVSGELLYLHPEEFGWGRADESWVDLGDPSAPAMEDVVPATAASPVHATLPPLEARIRAALDARDAPLTCDSSARRSRPRATCFR
jgi:hypothetical protein